MGNEEMKETKNNAANPNNISPEPVLKNSKPTIMAKRGVNGLTTVGNQVIQKPPMLESNISPKTVLKYSRPTKVAKKEIKELRTVGNQVIKNLPMCEDLPYKCKPCKTGFSQKEEFGVHAKIVHNYADEIIETLILALCP